MKCIALNLRPVEASPDYLTGKVDVEMNKDTQTRILEVSRFEE
ncbi:MAG: hypothetical protein ACFB2Y_03945 [Fulvivirga sp.]